MVQVGLEKIINPQPMRSKGQLMKKSLTHLRPIEIKDNFSY